MFWNLNLFVLVLIFSCNTIPFKKSDEKTNANVSVDPFGFSFVGQEAQEQAPTFTKLISQFNQTCKSEVLLIGGGAGRQDSKIESIRNLSKEDGMVAKEGGVINARGMDLAFDYDFISTHQADLLSFKIFCHAVGHKLGFQHSQDPKDLMYYAVEDSVDFDGYCSQVRAKMGRN